MMREFFSEIELYRPSLPVWVRRNKGALFGWLVGLAVIGASTWGLFYGIGSWLDNNPAYGNSEYTVKQGETVANICIHERPTMGLDKCLTMVFKRNPDVLTDGLAAGEQVILPDGR